MISESNSQIAKLNQIVKFRGLWYLTNMVTHAWQIKREKESSLVEFVN